MRSESWVDLIKTTQWARRRPQCISLKICFTWIKQIKSMKQLLWYKQGNQSLGSSLGQCTGSFNLYCGWARSSVVERMFSVQRALNSVLSVRGKYPLVFCVLEWILSPPCSGGGTLIAGEKRSKKTFTCQPYTQTPLSSTDTLQRSRLAGSKPPPSSFVIISRRWGPGAVLGMGCTNYEVYAKKF